MATGHKEAPSQTIGDESDEVRQGSLSYLCPHCYNPFPSERETEKHIRISNDWKHKHRTSQTVEREYLEVRMVKDAQLTSQDKAVLKHYAEHKPATQIAKEAGVQVTDVFNVAAKIGKRDRMAKADTQTEQENSMPDHWMDKYDTSHLTDEEEKDLEKKLNEGIVEAIKDAYTIDKSPIQIAHDAGVSRGLVYRVAKLLGGLKVTRTVKSRQLDREIFEAGPNPPKTSKDDLTQNQKAVLDAWLDNPDREYRLIADEVGVSNTYVGRCIRQFAYLYKDDVDEEFIDSLAELDRERTWIGVNTLNQPEGKESNRSPLVRNQKEREERDFSDAPWVEEDEYAGGNNTFDNLHEDLQESDKKRDVQFFTDVPEPKEEEDEDEDLLAKITQDKGHSSHEGDVTYENVPDPADIDWDNLDSAVKSRGEQVEDGGPQGSSDEDEDSIDPLYDDHEFEQVKKKNRELRGKYGGTKRALNNAQGRIENLEDEVRQERQKRQRAETRAQQVVDERTGEVEWLRQHRRILAETCASLAQKEDEGEEVVVQDVPAFTDEERVKLIHALMENGHESLARRLL